MILERGALLNNRYRIVEILGQGGMGSVYRAIDENLGVEVAVKDNLFTTEDYASQFRREAVILANLRHPNLPRVTDHFVIEGQGQYLVMDYIEGEDLRQRMDRTGLLSEEEAIVIGAAICDALTYLDSRNPSIVHRDIKPGNVKITPQGQIYLVDFGLAKVLYGSEATSTGARAMTPGYSPPEQYGTARTDHRSDIFSLGATLYAGLTGAIPEDALARAMGQAELTPIRKHNPRISRRLSSIIEKALEVRPDDRQQTAEEFKRALLAARTSPRRKLDDYLVPPAPEEERSFTPGAPSGRSSRPKTGGSGPQPPDRSPLPIPMTSPLSDSVGGGTRSPFQSCFLVVLFVLLLGLIGGLGYYAYDPDMASEAVVSIWPGAQSFPAFGAGFSPTPSLTSPPVATATQLPIATAATSTSTELPPTGTPTLTPTETPEPTETPTLTPTPLGGGNGQVAFASDASGTPQIFIINVDGSGLKMVTDMLEGACQPSWSPDGLQVVFTSPCDGNQVAYPGSGLFIINTDGSGLKPLLSMAGGDYDPAWSPDGSRIAFTSVRNNGRPQVFVYHFADGSVDGLSEKYSWDMQPRWSNDGRHIVFVSTRRGRHQIWTMDADGSNQEPLTHNTNLESTHPDWNPDSSLVLYTQSAELLGIPRLMVVQDIEDSEEVPPEFRVSQDQMPMREGRYSPDGFWIAFEGWPAGANHDIYIIAANGAGRRQLTTNPRTDFDPAWRPDPLLAPAQ